MTLTDEQCAYWMKVRDSGITAVPIKREADNLGDDFLTIAAMDWLGVREVIKRDSCDRWKGHRVILSHFFWDMPVPDDANVVVAGFYLCRHHLPKLEAKGLWDRLKRAVEAQGFPAGCRDMEMVKLFQEHDIPAVFSGCVTQTMKHRAQPSDLSLAVDVPVPQGWIGLSHKLPELVHMSREAREKYARDRLDMYAYAKEIITSRLHCYLPSRSMGVKVTPVTDKVPMKDRWSGHLH